MGFTTILLAAFIVGILGSIVGIVKKKKIILISSIFLMGSVILVLLLLPSMCG